MSDVSFVDLGVDLAGTTSLAVDGADTLAVYEILLPDYFNAFTDADFLAALQALMPRGLVWPTDPDAVQTKVLAGLAPTATRLTKAAVDLLSDAFPATAVNLLAEWEASLGLPDPCAGASPLLQLRQMQVVARLVGTGGQSVGYFVALAASLGYPITITEYTGANAHKWQVNAPTISEIFFRAGQSTAGEPLTAGGNAVLECVINEQKPAHTIVTFHYGP